MSNQASYVVDSKGKKVAVQVPIKVYWKLLEAWEELNDIAAYDKIKKKQGKLIPFETLFIKLREQRNNVHDTYFGICQKRRGTV